MRSARHAPTASATADEIESVILTQIAYPVEEPLTGSPGMPADIVTGEDADSVAAYVSSVAGLPVRPRPPTETSGGGETTGGGGDDWRRGRRPEEGRPREAARPPEAGTPREARARTARRSSPKPKPVAAVTRSRLPARPGRFDRTWTSRSRRRSRDRPRHERPGAKRCPPSRTSTPRSRLRPSPTTSSRAPSSEASAQDMPGPGPVVSAADMPQRKAVSSSCRKSSSNSRRKATVAGVAAPRPLVGSLAESPAPTGFIARYLRHSR